MQFFDTMHELITNYWPHMLVTVISLVLTVVAGAHLVMYKKDTRAAIGWLGVVVMSPILGAVAYSMFGINRLHRKAQRVRSVASTKTKARAAISGAKDLAKFLGPDAAHLTSLEHLIGELTGRPLLSGNRVTPLVGGAEAYPQMLAAIDEAKTTLTLCSYIFDNDRTGRQFADALGRAVKRGVAVRVIVDAVGARYTFPSIIRRLKSAGVPVDRFLPTLLPGRMAYANLRSHRKILVADGRLGFTGGCNIRDGHDARLQPSHPISDHHFRIEGPVVAQLQEVFAEDWEFCTDEVLEGETWFPKIDPVGQALARGISAGPDEDLDKLRLTLEGALTVARRSVLIATPYFLPEAALVSALNVAALRGVEVDIILPEANNLALVKWASTAMLWQVLERGCRVWLSPPPFDHTKLMLVDRAWTLLGSGNWDPRSLRLNFEFDVEVYDAELSETLYRWMMDKRKAARQVTLADVDGRSLPIRLRDGVARLLTPYL